MTISGAIRDWCNFNCDCLIEEDDCDILRGFADEIEDEMVELPVDREGAPIHVGDRLYDCDTGKQLQVKSLNLEKRWGVSTNAGFVVDTSRVTHEMPDSWERIADELEKWGEDNASASWRRRSEMKISDEIRAWCDDTTPWPTRHDARAIADRIDAEMVELPKDADGEVIHVGDTLHDRVNNLDLQVEALRFDGQWEIRTGLGYSVPSWFVPVHADSLYRIADELDKWFDKLDAWSDGVYVDKNACPELRGFADRIRKLAKEDER